MEKLELLITKKFQAPVNGELLTSRAFTTPQKMAKIEAPMIKAGATESVKNVGYVLDARSLIL
jgi:hypothetical protein